MPAVPDGPDKCDNFMSGKDVLKTFEMAEDHNVVYRLAMIGLAIGYHLIGFTVLTIRMWLKRR